MPRKYGLPPKLPTPGKRWFPRGFFKSYPNLLYLNQAGIASIASKQLHDQQVKAANLKVRPYVPHYELLWRNRLNQLTGTGFSYDAGWYPFGYSGGDPYWNQVTFLCKFEGSDGDQSATDVSGNAVNINFVGSGDISEDQAKFNNTSYHHVGNSRLILGSASPSIYEGFLMEDQDFTIEMFIYLPAETGLTNYIFGFGNVAPAPDLIGWALYYNSTNNAFTGYSTTADGAGSVTVAFDLDTDGEATGIAGFLGSWKHIHYSRNGSDLIVGVDGYNKINEGNFSGEVYDCSGMAQGPCLGAAPSNAGATSDDLPFYMDEFRVTKGVARYTGATYDVPTTAFPTQ